MTFDENKDISSNQINALLGREDVSPIDITLNSIRNNAKQPTQFIDNSIKLESNNIFANPVLEQNKPSLTQRIYNVDEAFVNVGGEYIAKFPTYERGVDNAEVAAQRQSTMDKWLNGTAKALGKTGNAIIGGTLGTAYGISKGIQDQSLSSVYDNDFSNWLNDLDQKMNYKLPNYYTRQEQDLGLFGQTTTANFWADKVLGGLSFTAGAIVSEGIWAWATGGASLALTGTRWSTKALSLGKVGSAVGKYSKQLTTSLPKNMFAGAVSKTKPVLAGQLGEALNTVRFTMTSAGYEASVEALQFKKEAQENFYNNFERLNGRQPSEQEILDFEDNLTNSANAVFGTNMAVVGSSNLMAFGKIFNIKSPIKTGMSSFLDKKLYGLGIDDATKTITPNKLQKINRYTLPYVRSMVEEGLYEEGMQSVTSNTANKWIEHTYNPQNQNESFDMMGAIYESLSHQYGTKEGWVENGVGMIIGILGEAGTRGRSAEVKTKEAKFQQEADYAKTYTNKALGEHMLMLTRMKGFSQEAEIAAKQGNLTAEKIATDGVMYSYLNHSYQIGRDLNDTVEHMQTSLDTLTADQFKEIGVEPSEIESYKEQTISAFKEVVGQFSQNRKYAEYLIGRNQLKGLESMGGNRLEALGVNASNELLIQAVTYNLTAGENAGKLMDDVVSTLQSEVGAELTSSLTVARQLAGQKGAVVRNINKSVNELKALETEREAITRELSTVQNAPRELEPNREQGDRVGQLTQRLLEVNSRVDELNSSLTDLTRQINNNKEFRQGLSEVNVAPIIDNNGIISLDDLVNLDDNVKKLEALIENYKTINPQKAAYIEELLGEFENANKIFKDNQRTVLAISSGKIKLSNINTWIGSKLEKKATLDEFTNEWLTDLLENYTSKKMDVMTASANNQEVENISEEDWKNFTDGNTVSDEIITNIVNKIVNQQPLSKREEAIRSENSEQVEDLLKQTVKPVSEKVAEVPIPKTKAEFLRDRLQSLIDDRFNHITPIIQPDGTVVVEKPTKAEVEEYRELLKQPEGSLFQERLDELEAKLGQWRLLDSAIGEDGVSLAELIEQLSQVEQEVQEEETVSEITQDDSVLLNDDIPETGKIDVFELAQNTLGSVTVRMDNNNYDFSHLSVSDLIGRIGGNVVMTTSRKSTQNPTSEEIDNAPAGTVFEVDGIKFVKKDQAGTISINKDVLNTNKNRLNLYVVNTSDKIEWSYKDVFQFNGSEFVKVPSSYEEQIEPQEIYNLKPTDKVSFEVAIEDSYTQKLLKDYNKDKSVENYKKLLEGVKIYVKTKNGIRVSTLKALRGATKETQIYEIRERAVKSLLNETPNTGMEAEVSNIFMGSPKFNLDENGNIQNLDFTNGAVSTVLATGFVQDGNVTLNKTFTEEVDKTYIGQISKKNKGKKIPVVVVQRGAYKIAYPITVKKSTANLGSLIETVIQKPLTKAQMAIEINNLIQENRVNTPKVIAEDITEQKVQEIIDAFNNKESFRTADEFAAEMYNFNSLKADAQINIRLENIENVISDAKVRLDFSTLIYRDTVDVLEDDLVSVESRLSDLAVSVYNDYYTNKDGKYTNSRGEILEDTHYTNTFDDTPIVKSSESTIILRNINILEKAFSERLPQRVKKALGEEIINEVNSLITKRNRLLKSVKVEKEILKSGENKVEKSCKE